MLGDRISMSKTWLRLDSISSASSKILSSNITILALLYFVQGLPYGFQARFLPVYLRTNGVSLTNLGLMKLLLVPWLLKVIWAPLVDTWGTKRQWLLYSILGLALTCLLGAFVTPDILPLLCMVVFLLNFLAATQDIAVDGIAISILGEEELGKGNTAQVVGYKIGSVVGGGFLVWLSEFMGWFGLFTNLSIVYFITLIIVSKIPELKSEKQKYKLGSIKGHIVKSKTKDTVKVDNANVCDREIRRQTCMHTVLRNGKTVYKDSDHSAIRKKSRDLKRNDTLLDVIEGYENITQIANKEIENQTWLSSMFGVPGTLWMMVYVVTYKLGEQGAIGLLPLYLVDCNISASHVGLWTGVIGQSLSILGSLVAGWMLSYYMLKPMSLLPTLFFVRIIPLVLMNFILWCDMVNEQSIFLYGLSITAMCLLQFIGGLITTATFTMMMQCSQNAPQDMQATHWTTLATLEVMGKLLFMSAAGFLTDWLGYPVVFVFLLLLSVIVIPLFGVKVTSKHSQKML
ncbi:major facilitator superfamily domain-containing protein 3-like [Glandiceps talaboti]